MARKHPAAVALGKLRMSKITPEERRELGRIGGLAGAGIPRPNARGPRPRRKRAAGIVTEERS